MISTSDAYSYWGHRPDKLKFRPYCSVAGTPAILIEGPRVAILLNLLNAEPFVDDLRAAAAGARRNAAVTRRPWSPRWAA